MNPEYKIIISDAAFSMLDTHMDFLAKASQNAAIKVKDKIIEDMRSLQENPQRFPVYESPFITDTKYRKMVSGKRYLIIYEITNKTVFIDYILDCRQDYEWLVF